MGRGGADDAAPFLRLHARNRGAHRVERRREIDGDDGVPLVGRKVLDRRDMLDAGVVDEDVHRSHLGFGVGDHRLDLGALGHVGRVVESLDPELLLDFGPLGLDRRLVAEPVDDDIRALLGEGAGDRQADAARRTGDKGVAFGERHRRFSSWDRGQTVRAERSYCIAMKLSRHSLQLQQRRG